MAMPSAHQSPHVGYHSDKGILGHKMYHDSEEDPRGQGNGSFIDYDRYHSGGYALYKDKYSTTARRPPLYQDSKKPAHFSERKVSFQTDQMPRQAQTIMNNRSYDNEALGGSRSQSNLLRKSISNAALEQYQRERGIAGDSKGFVAASLGGHDPYHNTQSQRIIPVLPKDSS